MGLTLLFVLLQEEPLQVPGALQDGREPLGIHRHRLRHEGVRLVPGKGLQLREAEAQHHTAQRRLHAAAAGVRGHSGCQVRLG